MRRITQSAFIISLAALAACASPVVAPEPMEAAAPAMAPMEAEAPPVVGVVCDDSGTCVAAGG